MQNRQVAHPQYNLRGHKRGTRHQGRSSEASFPTRSQRIQKIAMKSSRQQQQKHRRGCRVFMCTALIVAITVSMGNFASIFMYTNTELRCNSYRWDANRDYGNAHTNILDVSNNISYCHRPRYDNIPFNLLLFSNRSPSKHSSRPNLRIPFTPSSSMHSTSSSHTDMDSEITNTTQQFKKHQEHDNQLRAGATSTKQDQQLHQSFQADGRSFAIGLLDDINYTQPGLCGAQKCLFLSKSNSSVGYLLPKVKFGDKKKNWNNTLYGGFSIAQELSRDYPQIPHSYHEGPPVYISRVSQFYTDRLNSNSPIVLKQFEDEKRYGKAMKRQYQSKSPIYIQPLDTAPTPNALLGCSNERHNLSMENLILFVNDHVLLPVENRRATASYDGGNQRRPSLPPALPSSSKSLLLSFFRNLSQDINLIEHNMTKDPKYSCLLYDFQFLIDFSGRLHHVDLDRCFDYDGSKHTEEKYEVPRDRCFDNVHKMIKHARDFFVPAS